MSQWLYAIIPYKSGITFSKDGPYSEPLVYCPVLPELKDISSEFTDPEALYLFKDFLMINICYRQSAFTNNRDGSCWIMDEIRKIARALGASEVLYVAELLTDEMIDWDFSFEEWRNRLRKLEKQYVVELSTDILKGNTCYSYYHDDFSDVI